MHLRIQHACGADEALRRLLALAREHGIEIESDGSGGGRLAHRTPVGAVRARFVVEETEIVVEVEKKPAFLPADVVRRAVEDGLRRVLATDGR